MKGHAHDWAYLHPTKRVCNAEGCERVELLTDAGDWVPVEWVNENPNRGGRDG